MSKLLEAKKALEQARKLNGGAGGAGAGGGGGKSNGTGLRMKQPENKGVNFTNKAEIQKGELQYTFEKLAEIKQYRDRGIASNAAMDNPIEWLNRRDYKGNYAVTTSELGSMISVLAAKGAGKEGISFGDWLAKSGKADAIATGLETLVKTKHFDMETSQYITRALSAEFGGGMVTKALDSTSGSPAGSQGGFLIRTDLDPILRIAYLRVFPANDIIRKIPANGLVHTYNTVDDPGTAVAVGELQDLASASADTQSTFSRKTSTNIAILASRRGISLKLQYAVAQSGMLSYDLSGPNNLEVLSAVTSIARLKQSLFFQGNQTQATYTLDDEQGLYNQYAFDGLRWQLADSAYSLNKGITQTYVDVLDQAAGQIMNAGGMVDDLLMFTTVGGKRAMNAELLNFYRILNEAPNAGSDNDLARNGIVTVSDYLTKIQAVPSDAQGRGIGYYTYSAAATEDMYVIDPNAIAFPYLGSPDPVILELPVGYNGYLSNVYIPFEMTGLMVEVPKFNRKIRIPKTIV